MGLLYLFYSTLERESDCENYDPWWKGKIRSPEPSVTVGFVFSIATIQQEGRT